MSSARRLLLAVDDGSLRFLLAAALRTDGYRVVAVSTGVDLFDILDESLGPDGELAPFDLVLSDLCIQGRPCLEGMVLRRCKPHMPPVILIARTMDESMRRQADASRALTVLLGPLDIDHLRTVVAGLLSRSSSDDFANPAPRTRPAVARQRSGER